MSMPDNLHSEDERAEALKRDGLLIGVAALSLLNGMQFSPFFDYGFILFRPIASGLFITSPLLTFYLTSLLLAASTLALSGVVPALYERFTGRTTTDSRSLTIWLVTVAILSLPSVLGAAGQWGG